VMVTGDNERVASVVGRELGLTEVHAGLLPEDKVRAISDLTEEQGAVGMVGDGVNDAPAMASARVGIAMGGAGTGVALETSDVALMADDLAKLPFAIGLGRAARRTIRQNLAVALATIALLVPAALSGWATIGPAIVFHEGSTLLVVANALRLLRFRDR
jgi:Zn2+/Cd2+-exporting ATPase